MILTLFNGLPPIYGYGVRFLFDLILIPDPLIGVSRPETS